MKPWGHQKLPTFNSLYTRSISLTVRGRSLLSSFIAVPSQRQAFKRFSWAGISISANISCSWTATVVLVCDKSRAEVAPAVDDAQHLRDVARSNPIENHVRPLGNGTHLVGDRRVVADPALSRRETKRRTSVADAPDYRIGALGATVGRDVPADRGEVASRRPSETIARQSAFDDWQRLREKLREKLFAVNEVARIGRVDALLNVGP